MRRLLTEEKRLIFLSNLKRSFRDLCIFVRDLLTGDLDQIFRSFPFRLKEYRLLLAVLLIYISCSEGTEKDSLPGTDCPICAVVGKAVF